MQGPLNQRGWCVPDMGGVWGNVIAQIDADNFHAGQNPIVPGGGLLGIAAGKE